MRIRYPSKRPLYVHLILVMMACAALSSRAIAESPPTISNAPQLFVQRGQSIDVTLDGNFLAAVNSVGLSHPGGMRANLIEPDKNAKPDNAHLRLHLSADADAALGRRELRLI